MTFTQSEPTTDALRELASTHLPGDDTYDAQRMPWNVAVDQRPAAVVVPETIEQIIRAVRTARALGLRVAAQATGHGAAAVGRDLEDVVLVRTSRLRGVYVDTRHGIARVEPGAIWQDVLDAAAPHGLTALHGSAPDVGVVGYSLGGGLSWYARKHGLACNSITAVEIVTAEGEVVRADAEDHADLFWAVRGGGGSFGIVTALEIRLFPVEEVYAGMMIWDLARAADVLPAWAEWCEAAPEEVTTSLRFMRFPPLPELPPFLSGRSLVIIDGVVHPDAQDPAGVVAALADLGPEMNTFGMVPSAGLTALHMDPPEPTPGVGAGIVLDRLDASGVAAFLAAVGPDATTGVFMAELRQLGGALARPAEEAGVLSSLPGSHAAFFVAIAPTAEAAEHGRLSVEGAASALSDVASGRHFLNLTERPVDTSSAYERDAWRRLCAVRAAVDPDGLFVAAHQVPSEH